LEAGYCPCEGRSGWGLALCLAPPRGEYELEYPAGSGAVIAISRDGVFLRQIRAPETLPFMETVERPISEAELERRGITWLRVACDSIKALRGAAGSGSRLARGLLEACSGVVGEVERLCGGGGDGEG